jgi:outer membrane protein OmpA-like peptidoglycan-associated protein
VGNSDTLVFTSRAYMSGDGGHLDIHTLKRIIKPEPKLFLSGLVTDNKTQMPIGRANVKFLFNSEVIKVVQADSLDALFRLSLPTEGRYKIEVQAEGYLPLVDSVEVNLAATKGDTEVYKNLYLQPLEVGLSVRLDNIFFDFDKTTLRAESYPALDEVVELMEQNPTLRIEIAGHTDEKGSEEYNKNLSQGRAEAVVAYIVGNFIDSNRIVAKGYGEGKPQVTNNSEANRQINRRVEFTILENKHAQAGSGW